jgi:hypothetical protein
MTHCVGHRNGHRFPGTGGDERGRAGMGTSTLAYGRGRAGTIRDGRGRLQHGSGPQGRGFDSLQAHHDLTTPLADVLPNAVSLVTGCTQSRTVAGGCVIRILNEPCLANWTWPYLLWRGAERSRWASFALAVVSVRRHPGPVGGQALISELPLGVAGRPPQASAYGGCPGCDRSVSSIKAADQLNAWLP